MLKYMTFQFTAKNGIKRKNAVSSFEIYTNVVKSEDHPVTIHLPSLTSISASSISFECNYNT